MPQNYFPQIHLHSLLFTQLFFHAEFPVVRHHGLSISNNFKSLETRKVIIQTRGFIPCQPICVPFPADHPIKTPDLQLLRFLKWNYRNVGGESKPRELKTSGLQNTAEKWEVKSQTGRKSEKQLSHKGFVCRIIHQEPLRLYSKRTYEYCPFFRRLFEQTHQ